MNSTDTTAPALSDKRKGPPRLLGLLFLLTGALTATAQSVIAPAPEVSFVPAAITALAPPPLVPVPAYPASPFNLGPVILRPHLLYRYLYGDGIQSSPGQQKTTGIHYVSPGLQLELGTHWTFDYTPTWTTYSNPVFKDSFNHALNLAGGTTYEDWILKLNETYSTSSSPLVETGRQTDQKNFTSGLSASYHFGSKMLLDTEVNSSARTSSAFPDSREWTVVERLHYQYAPQLDTALSLDYGYVSMSAGSDMSYLRPQAQITWKPTDKINLVLQGGVEHRDFRGGTAGNLTTPIYSASLNYLPSETTTLSFSGGQNITTSYFANQITERTQGSVNLQQRILKHFMLSVGYSQSQIRYFSTNSSLPAGRRDHGDSLNARFSTTFFQRGTLAVVYTNGHNSTNLAGFNYSTSQTGVEVGYRY
jgi:hypothetical protein